MFNGFYDETELQTWATSVSLYKGQIVLSEAFSAGDLIQLYVCEILECIMIEFKSESIEI